MNASKLIENIKDSQAEVQGLRAAVSAVNGQTGLGAQVRVLIPTDGRDPVAVTLPKALLLDHLNDKIAATTARRNAMQEKLRRVDEFLGGLA